MLFILISLNIIVLPLRSVKAWNMISPILMEYFKLLLYLDFHFVHSEGLICDLHASSKKSVKKVILKSKINQK